MPSLYFMHMVSSGKKRELLTSHNSPIRYGPEIVTLLKAVHLPKEVAVIYLGKDIKRENI